jgi:hypothetical protein
MQKSTSFTTKVLSLLFPGFLTFFIISSLLSCTDTDNKSGKSSLTNQSDTATGLKLNCVILTKAQVQAWVDSGWTKPGAIQIKELVFQPFIADVNGINANMQLVVYPGQSSTDVKLYGKQELAIDTTCTGKRITGPLTLGNLSMKFDSLKILNSDGTLKDFDFIRFVPAQDHPPYTNFNFEVINKGEVQLRDPGPSVCPPACCPPYCN